MTQVNANLAAELGERLSQSNIVWSIDRDGDVVVRYKGFDDEAVMPASLQLKSDFKVQVDFFPSPSYYVDGQRRWDIPQGEEKHTLAFKVVTLYFRPHQDRLVLQIYPSVEFEGGPHKVLVDTAEELLNHAASVSGLAVTQGPGQTGLAAVFEDAMPSPEGLKRLVKWGFQTGMGLFGKVVVGSLSFPEEHVRGGSSSL